MIIENAIATLNSKFVYTADKHLLRDNWTIIKDFSSDKVYGDCEDYSLTLLWLISKNKTEFWRKLRYDYSLYFVKLRSGEGHIVLYSKDRDQYIDNITKKFVNRDELIKRGYKFKFKAPLWFIWIKLKI